jgi:hypothetical protein
MATTEAVEGARKLRVGGGGVPAPKKVWPLIRVRGMPTVVPDQRRWSLGQGDEVRGRVDVGLVGGG